MSQILPLPDTTPLQRALLQSRTTKAPPSAPQSIVSLLNLDPLRAPVAAVRGTVVLTRPTIFVQDSTGGGVEVLPESPSALKIGDEVEVTGEVNLDKVNPVIRQARFRLLREAVPVSPLALTANQLAEGHYDGMFVQVEGYLRSISNEADGTVSLRLDGGTQTFHAIAAAGRSWAHLRSLAVDSRLRLKGIAVGDARFNKGVDPFVILARSAEDVDVLAGPPWWRPSTLTFTGLAALALLFAINHLYLLAKHWRLRAVAEERERLAHEIHDTLAQSFAGIGFQLQAIRNSMPRDAQVLERQVDLAMSMARTSHEEARRSIASLRPESLGRVGLLAALRECAERMVKSGNVTVETCGEDDGRLVPLHVKRRAFPDWTGGRRQFHPACRPQEYSHQAVPAARVALPVGRGRWARLPGGRRACRLRVARDAQASGKYFRLTADQELARRRYSRGNKSGDRFALFRPGMATFWSTQESWCIELRHGDFNHHPAHDYRRPSGGSRGLASMLSTQPDIDVVASASSGTEALSLLEIVAPDMILMDLRMPGMSGLEAMRIINARPDPPRIIVLTSFDTDEDIYQSVGAGAHGYVLKDTPQDQLLEAIKVVNAKGRYFPADIASRLTERMARSNLTPREHQVLQTGRQGTTNKEIGQAFGISDNTARNHVNSIIEKLEVSDRTEAATIAMRQGLVPLTD